MQAAALCVPNPFPICLLGRDMMLKVQRDNEQRGRIVGCRGNTGHGIRRCSNTTAQDLTRRTFGTYWVLSRDLLRFRLEQRRRDDWLRQRIRAKTQEVVERAMGKDHERQEIRKIGIGWLSGGRIARDGWGVSGYLPGVDALKNGFGQGLGWSRAITHLVPEGPGRSTRWPACGETRTREATARWN